VWSGIDGAARLPRRRDRGNGSIIDLYGPRRANVYDELTGNGLNSLTMARRQRLQLYDPQAWASSVPEPSSVILPLEPAASPSSDNGAALIGSGEFEGIMRARPSPRRTSPFLAVSQVLTATSHVRPTPSSGSLIVTELLERLQ
jgi:hypothetical protein